MAVKCPGCGMELEDGTRFCIRCGTAIPEVSAAQTASAAEQSQTYRSSTGAKGFVGEGEGGSFSLKNGRVMNIMSGEGFVKEDAILTDKRLYYSARSGLINVNSLEEIVDIKDITGTKIADFKPYSFFIVAVVALIAMLIAHQAAIGFALAVIFVVLFFIVKKSHLRIEYAGGSINFSVKKYGLANVREFQRQIYLAKERLNK